MKFNSNYILLLSLGLFALMSAITTAIGVDLVMIAYPSSLRYLLAGGIAMATSLMMIFLGYKVPEYARSARIFGVILAYLVIASLSLFFNFHTFFGSQTKNANLMDDALKLRKGIDEIQALAAVELDSFYQISDYEKIAAANKVDMDNEVDHDTRPGKGPRHQMAKARYRQSVEKLDLLREKYEVDKSEIEAIARIALPSLDEAISTGDLENLGKAIDRGENSYNKIASFIQAKDGGFIVPELSLGARFAERPDYVLNAIREYFSENSTMSKDERARFNLSLFISFLLDFPIFITLVVLGKGTRKEEEKPSRTRKPNEESYWTDPPSRDASNRMNDFWK